MADGGDPPDDMAGGTRSPDEVAAINWRLKLDRQRHVHRTIVFYGTLIASVIFVALFARLELLIAAAFEKDSAAWIGWPVLFLCSALLVATTVLLLTTMRIAYRTDAYDAAADEKADLPYVELVKLTSELLKLRAGKE